MLQKPTLTAEQKKCFEDKFKEIVSHPEAKEAIKNWKGEFVWPPNIDKPGMPGFNSGKLHGILIDRYVILLNGLINRRICDINLTF